MVWYLNSTVFLGVMMVCCVKNSSPYLTMNVTDQHWYQPCKQQSRKTMGGNYIYNIGKDSWK